MVTITPDQIIIYGTAAAVVLLTIIIYFTRATRSRIAGALVGGIATGLMVILVDTIASSLGLWYYPGSTTGYGPLGYYIPGALFYGSGMALIGWRINRRFGINGLFIFVILFGFYGVIRDYVGTALTQSSNILVLGSGMVPVIADILAYMAGLTIALIVMWIIAGPAKEDQLARTSTK